MPFLRVIRDKRGYETTYLLHWYREGARQRSRILYVFRSPGSTRVGRDPLDPDLMRELEALHPDIEFDWPAMREQRQVIDAVPEVRRRRPRRADRPGDPGADVDPAESADTAEPVDTADPGQAAESGGAAAPGDRAVPGATVPAEGDAGAGPPAGRASTASSPAIPVAIEGATPAEQMAFLQHWYPIVLERIPRRMADPERQAALTALAARLNPDGWTDADQMTAGLQDAAEALARLSRVLARRRRRSRRRPGAGEPPGAGGAAGEPDPAVDDGLPDPPDQPT